jgi:lipopolysaccharide/colanic/teichoic acid biosynthesis glycosyltransferase
VERVRKHPRATAAATLARFEDAEAMAIRLVSNSTPSSARLLRRVGGEILQRPAPRLLRPGYERAKRAFDLVVCMLLLPAALALVALCSLAVLACDGRPIFFFQHRTGRGGRRFRMYKFRTMVANAAELKAELAALNRLSGPDFKIANDPRITKLGALLRKTSLDEVPQLLNVLRGEMSLVGPRPTSFEASTYDLWHTERLEVAPGITGLWQVSGRSDVDFDDRVRLDIEYLERRSFGFDLWILFRTVAALVQQRGAY